MLIGIVRVVGDIKMRNFYLYGLLADKIGSDVVKVKVSNLAQFISYLEQYDVRKELLENDWVIGIGKDVDNLQFITSSEGLLLDLNDNDVWIGPVINGQAPVFGFIGAIFSGALFGGGIIGAIVANLASALLFYGISQIISPTPKAPTQGTSGYTPALEQPSFLFNGAVNITEQGGAVPIVYGRARCGSVVISSSVRSEQLL